MQKPRRDWVVFGDGSNPEFPFGFTCTRCGTQEKLPESIPMSVLLVWGKIFTELHKDCKEEKEAKP